MAMEKNTEWELVPERISLGVGRIPGRKSLAIYVHKPGVVSVLGYLRNEESAEEVIDLISKIAFRQGVKEEENERAADAS